MSTIQFSDRTLQVLKNFAGVNEGMLFRPGHEVRTVSPTKAQGIGKIYAVARIPENIGKEFAIANLNRLFSALSLFEAPTVTLGEHKLTIESAGDSLDYTYANPEVIVAPPSGTFKMPTADVEFDVTQRELSNLLKAAGALGLPEVAVVGEGGKLYLRTINAKKPTSDVFSIEKGETDKTFQVVFKTEGLRMIPGDYHVAISFRKIACFSSSDIEYFVTAEEYSTVP